VKWGCETRHSCSPAKKAGRCGSPNMPTDSCWSWMLHQIPAWLLSDLQPPARRAAADQKDVGTRARPGPLNTAPARAYLPAIAANQGHQTKVGIAALVFHVRADKVDGARARRQQVLLSRPRNHDQPSVDGASPVTIQLVQPAVPARPDEADVVEVDLVLGAVWDARGALAGDCGVGILQLGRVLQD